MERGLIPPNLLLKNVNPRIDLFGWNLKVSFRLPFEMASTIGYRRSHADAAQIPTELIPWPTKGPRRASVNSFGYGGTNAHLILDSAYHYLKARGLRGAHNTVINPQIPFGSPVPSIPSTACCDSSEASSSSRTSSESSDRSSFEVIRIKDTLKETLTAAAAAAIKSDYPRLLVWSSHEQKGTDVRAASILSYLSEHDDTPDLLDRLAFTLSDRRTHFQWRSFAVASNSENVKTALAEPAKPLRALDNPVLCFVFNGQGAQWYAMGRELMAYRLYQESIEAAADYMKAVGADWDLVSELMADEAVSRVGEPAMSHPACTALQIALVDLLEDWGVRPSVTAGHSSGEIAVSRP